MSPSRLRAGDLAKPYWGVRTPADAHGDPDSSVRHRCRAFAVRLPHGAAYSHTTAALLHGIPLPRLFESTAELHVSVDAGRRAIDARGIVGHAGDLAPSDVDTRHGVPATTPERTWCDLAALIPFSALIAAGDHLLFHEQQQTTIDLLGQQMMAHGSRRGARALRRALPLLSERAESPRESELRLMLHERGFPVPEVNHVLYDERGREWARLDLAYPGLKIAVEYEGDHHRTDQDQWRRDIARTRELESLGWIVIRVTLADLLDPDGMLRALTRAIDSRTSAKSERSFTQKSATR